MNKRWIHNFNELAKTEARRKTLEIIESGFEAIDTEKVISSSISFVDSKLTIKGQVFDVEKYKSIRVIGFGKASCRAAAALEKIIGPHVSGGGIISAEKGKCEYIETYQGTHPKPSYKNVEITKNLLDSVANPSKNDLIIVIVSGGGSALLIGSKEESDRGQMLYEAFLRTGGTIQELNIVRKHISSLKGGGLAKALYPAKIIGLIFSDIPGGYPQQVASGPTFKDESSKEDAQKILDKYNLGEFKLTETQKNDKYFKNITNILLTSNVVALDGMHKKAKILRFNPKIISSELYDSPREIVKVMLRASQENNLILAGGEPSIKIPKNAGKGGRCQQLAIEALGAIDDNQIFAAVASDGLDNTKAAGAIIDEITKNNAASHSLDIAEHLHSFSTYSFFKKTEDLILTGPTEANVSDLMILMTS